MIGLNERIYVILASRNLHLGTKIIGNESSIRSHSNICLSLSHNVIACGWLENVRENSARTMLPAIANKSWQENCYLPKSYGVLS